jgi:hypothetical protein
MALLSTVRAVARSERDRTAAYKSDSDIYRSSSGRENHSEDTRPIRCPLDTSTLKPNEDAFPAPAGEEETDMLIAGTPRRASGASLPNSTRRENLSQTLTLDTDDFDIPQRSLVTARESAAVRIWQ